LLADQSGRACDGIGAFPAREEELSEEGIERFLDPVFLVTAGILLLLEGGEEPCQDQQGATLRVGFRGRSNEDGRMSGPVGRELHGGLGGKDEGRGGDVGEVAADGCNGLGTRNE
jgi:hypothetical protein